jgi:uncharacterized membrane protein YhiD involved in acid resistance
MLKSITTAVIAIVIVLATLFMFGKLSERVWQLEEDVEGLKLQITQLTSQTGSANNRQKPHTSLDGWKTLANWRTLKKGMSYDNVRQILGEPARIQGGDVTFWFYPKGGVIFRNEKLDSWSEPM